MSMPQVYLTETSGTEGDLLVFSSRQKAITALVRIYPSAIMYGEDKGKTSVTVDGTTVGWITKKMVQ